VAPPDVAAERGDALRAAFAATMVDPEFLAELYRTPPEIVTEVRATIAPGAK
jgi:hypothetical protein